MPSATEDHITQLCDSFIAAVVQPDGSLVYGEASEKYRLYRNGINVDELDYEGIQTTCTELTRVLLFKRLNTFIGRDHQLLWAWAGEVLLAHSSPPFSSDERELHDLFATCIRAALAPFALARATGGGRENTYDANMMELTLNAHLALSYLAFPLLEGLLKKACNAFVDYDGTIKKPFPKYGSGKSVGNYSPGQTCSSLRDLLWLIFNNVADADLRARINSIRTFLGQFDATNDPFELVYAWRNQSLHGATAFQTIGGTILNLAILVALNQVRSSYEKSKEHARRRSQRYIEVMQSTGVPLLGHYFPPH